MASSVKSVHHLDTDTIQKLESASDKLSEFMHILANEPSIGLYHVSNHITRNVPKCVELRRQLVESTKAVEGMSYDMDYTLATIKDLRELNTFSTIKELLVASMTTVDLIKHGKPIPNAAPTTTITHQPSLPVYAATQPQQPQVSNITTTTETEPRTIDILSGENSGSEKDSPPSNSFEDGSSSAHAGSNAVSGTKKRRKGKDGKKKRKDFTMKTFEI